MYLSLLILNLIFRIILESPQSGESPKPSHFKGSKGHENPLVLFELNRSGWFAREVVEYSVYSVDLVDDPCHAGLEHVPWNVA